MRAKEFLFETGLTPAELTKNGRNYAEVLLTLAKEGPIDIVPEHQQKYGATVRLSPETISNLNNFVQGGDLAGYPTFITANNETVKGSWGAIHKSSKFTGRMGLKAYNAGHLNELFMGIAVAAKFMNQNKDVSVDQVRRLIFEAEPMFAEKRSTMDFNLNKVIKYQTKNRPDNLKFLGVIPTKSAQALINYGVGPLPGDLASILAGVVKYVNESDSVDAAVARVMRDPNTNNIEITSDGTSDSAGTKADMTLSIDGSKVTLLSLKTSSSDTLGQKSGVSFEALQYFFKTGFNIDLTPQQQMFDPSLGKNKLIQNVFKLYDTVIFPKVEVLMNQQNPGKESEIVKQLARAANIFARGEGLEDVEIVKVNDSMPQGAYKILRFSDGLYDAMKKLDLFAHKIPTKGKGRTIQIFVRPDVSGVNQKPAKLCQFRSQVMGKALRNYFESGTALDELVEIKPKSQPLPNKVVDRPAKIAGQINNTTRLQKSKIPMGQNTTPTV